MSSFVKRRIEVTINLATGQFGDTQGQRVTLSNHRVMANVITYNGDAQGQMQLRVFGLPLETINQLTTIGPIMAERRNNGILIAAGDEGGVLTTVYQGTIDSAYGEFQGSPEVVLNITALAAAVAAVKPVNASSYKGSTDVVTIMSELAKTMGFSFENNGVSTRLSNPYFSGTALEQVKSCARAADIYYAIDRGKLAIWPKSGARRSDPVEIAIDKNLVGYPSFSGNGIIFTILFNPDLQLGGRVNVTSSLEVACGIWNIYSVVHSLESENPGGAWFTQIACYRANNNG